MPLFEPNYDNVVVRFGGEIGIKAPMTRKLYERRLVSNIKAVLRRHALDYTALARKFGRLYIKTEKAEAVAEKISHVFGVASTSPALETTSNLDDITNVSLNLASSRIGKRQSFAIRCRRVGQHTYTSQDVCRHVGQSILTKLKEMNLQVSLTNPDQTIHIEVREDKAYIFTDILKGVGGLPEGTQPETVCLLKGNASSAVACWMTMKRGCRPIFIYFENNENVKSIGFHKPIATAQKLMTWGIRARRKLQVVTVEPSFQNLLKQYPPSLSDLLLKRLMLRVSRLVAKARRAEAIVVGDTLREKEHQTVHAFRLQDAAVKDYPVLRPLLGLDMQEVLNLGQLIGFDEPTQEKEYKMKIGKGKTTSISLEEVERVENELKIGKTVSNAFKALKVVKF